MTTPVNFSPARKAARLAATVLGVGFTPVAPGTAGTLAAVPLVLALGLLPWWGRTAAAIGVVLLAVVAAGAYARDVGRHDPPEVVIDEVAGYVIALLPVAPTLASLGAGFVLFRVLDVWKPPPARRMERLPLGWGIVLDDVVAGAYAAAALAGLDRLGWLAIGGG